MKGYTKTVLLNGLRIITVPRKDDLATTVLVLVEAGSKYETHDISGISHFLEHMCFKGTKKRPTAMDIAGELDGLGADYNAFTSQEYTGYYAKVEAHKLDQALDIVSDMYLNPVFDAKEIEKEKGVIIEEINMYDDLPQRKVNDYFMELLYGDQPAGWDIAGRKEVIRSATRDHFIEYRAKHYVPSATVVVVAGAFDENDIIKKIEIAFSGMQAGVKTDKLPVYEAQIEPRVLLKYKKADQTHCVIGCRAFGTHDPRKYALDVLSDILGGSMSSRLFQRVREELGAAYYVKASVDLYTDHGFLGVNMGIDQTKMVPVVEAVLEEMQRLAVELVPDTELARAKSHATGKLILGLESSDAFASYYGSQEILREPIVSAEELIKKINAVTAEEIQAVAKDIMKNEGLNMAVVGPVEDEGVLKKALRFS